MSGVNKAILVGYLGADPKIINNNDRKLATLSVATSHSWKDKSSGERKEQTEWHRVVIFNEGLVEVAEKYLKKGSRVYIEGMIATRKWQDKDGHDKFTTEIVLRPFNSVLVMLDRKKDGPPEPTSQDDYGTTSGGETSAKPAPKRDDFDDEIPF